MLHRFNVAAFLIFVPLLCDFSFAQTVVVPIAKDGVHLKGRNAEWSNFITIDNKKLRKSEPVLTLSWQKSQLINPKLSSVSVLIDGRPLRSMWLTPEDRGEHKIPLGGLVGGVHEIRVRTSMQIDEDPCLSARRDDAWFTITPQSNISWVRAATLPKRASVSELPALWPRSSDLRSAVAVDFQATLDADGMGAYLDLDHLLRRWSFVPTMLTDGTVAGKVRMMTLDRVRGSSEAAEQLRTRPDARFAMALDTSANLEIVGTDTLALRDAVLLLGAEPARTLCTEKVCLGSAQAIRVAQSTPATTQQALPPTEVWRLGKSTGGRPWVARGFGNQQTRFIWQRPAWWQIIEWPTLQLHAATSTSGAMDLSKSSINARVNDQPLATYSIAQWLAGKAEIKIPRELWMASEWVVDVQTTILPVETHRCSNSDQATQWVSISPETALWVPRKEAQYDGVANFFSESRASALPLLHVGDPTIQKLAILAPIVYPFVDQESVRGESQSRWQFVNAPLCESKRCIQLRNNAPADALLRFVDGRWIDGSGTLRVPIVPGQDTVALFYVAAAAPRVPQLVVVAGPLSAAPPTQLTPDFLGLIGRAALFSSDKWHTLDVRSRGLPTTLASPDADKRAVTGENVSVEQRKLRWLNFAWAAVSVLLVSALVVWLWRRPATKKADENWEVHK
jgi:Bacterial cellulose synthase subunit